MAMAKRQAHGFAAGAFQYLSAIVSRDEERFAIRAKRNSGKVPACKRNRRPDGSAGGHLPEPDDLRRVVCRQGDLAVRTEGNSPDVPRVVEGLADGLAAGPVPQPSRPA